MPRRGRARGFRRRRRIGRRRRGRRRGGGRINLTKLFMACCGMGAGTVRVAPTRAEMDMLMVQQAQFWQIIQQQQRPGAAEVQDLQCTQEDMVKDLDECLQKTEEEQQRQELERQRNVLLQQMQQMESAGYKYEAFPQGVPPPSELYGDPGEQGELSAPVPVQPVQPAQPVQS